MNSLLPPPRKLTRGVAIAVSIPFLLGLAMLTLTPNRVEDSVPGLLDLVLRAAQRIGWDWLNFTRLEILANVAVFIPVGILAFILVPRRIWPLALLVGPVMSIAIEVTQRVALPGRASTIDDVIANSSGALIGVFAAIACTLLFAPRNAQPTPRTLEAS